MTAMIEGQVFARRSGRLPARAEALRFAAMATALTLMLLGPALVLISLGDPALLTMLRGFDAVLLGRYPDENGPLFRFALHGPAHESAWELMERHGHLPLPPYIERQQALIDGGYDGKTVVLGIRPEDVHDSQAFISNSPDSVIESTIKVYELLGAEVFLYFDVDGTQMTARVNPRTTLRTGDHAVFALDMEKIHLFDKDTELTITN